MKNTHEQSIRLLYIISLISFQHRSLFGKKHTRTHMLLMLDLSIYTYIEQKNSEEGSDRDD